MPRKMILTSQNLPPGLELILKQLHLSFTSTVKHSTDIFSPKRSKNSVLRTFLNSLLMLKKVKLQAFLIQRPKLKKKKNQKKNNKNKPKNKNLKVLKVINRKNKKNFDVLFIILSFKNQ